MAELNTSNNNDSRKTRTRKLSTRVDLTAMVDLGFLLITFFMLATAFGEPKVMELIEPVPSEEEGPVYPVEKTMTILIGSNNVPYYYKASEKELESTVDSTDFSKDGLRQVIYERQLAVEREYDNANKLFVFIKPMPKADYRNVVNALDEILITNVKKYALIHEFSAADSLAVKEAGLRF